MLAMVVRAPREFRQPASSLTTIAGKSNRRTAAPTVFYANPRLVFN